MHLAFVLALLAALLAAWAPTATAQECPRLLLAAKVLPSAKRGILAGRKKAKITVNVRSEGAAHDVNFKMELPAGLSVVKLKTHPSRMPSRARIKRNPEGITAIYWTNIDFKKSSKRVFRAEVIADDCAPETLDVSALAYLVNATDLSTYCVSPLVEPVALRVRYPGNKKVGPITCAPTLAPSVNPATPFQLFGEGQRCLEAGLLAPFPDRRLSVQNDVDEELDWLTDTRNEYRGLDAVVIATPTECYTYCSIKGGEAAPFFFNWNALANQCFCCGGKCTLILDVDFDAYKVVETATAAPSASPSASPSALPSQLPSQQPSMLPTVMPSALPTTLPSQQPSMLPTVMPSALPTTLPTVMPSALPTTLPSQQPSMLPTVMPSALPTTLPSQQPSMLPTVKPSALPTQLPSKQPSMLPTVKPVVPATSCPAETFPDNPGCCLYFSECGTCPTGFSCYSSVCACQLAANPGACAPYSVVTCAL